MRSRRFGRARCRRRFRHAPVRSFARTRRVSPAASSAMLDCRRQISGARNHRDEGHRGVRARAALCSATQPARARRSEDDENTACQSERPTRSRSVSLARARPR